MEIRRKILASLIDHLQEPEITLLVGPRQVGKTTLMRILEEEVKRQHMPTLFLTLDDESQGIFFTSQAALLEKLRLHFGSKRGVVFIDEIQHKVDAGRFLKGLYDMRLPWKFVVSGSGSLELKERVQESLAGRKRMFVIHPISWAEFLNWKTAYQYQDRLDHFVQVESERAWQWLEEYITFGGYPKVILAETQDGKEAALRDIYASYLVRDISSLLGVDPVNAFSELVRVLAGNIGQLLNIAELSRTLHIDQRQVRQYLWYLEQTYIITRVTPYHRNVRSEVTKAPTIYFWDLGLRNWARRRLTLEHTRLEPGWLMQNFAALHLLEETLLSPSSFHFWRSKSGAEVDFVLQWAIEPIPIEVKSQALRRLSIPRSLRSFIEHYQPRTAIILNRSLRASMKIDQTEVRFIPIADWPLQGLEATSAG